jgi:hypothetical protein
MTQSPRKRRTTWVITDGKMGMVSPAMGLAEAVGFDIVPKTIRPAAPWKWLPANIWPAGASGVAPGGDLLDGEPPDLIVSCGRHAVGPALWLKRRHGDRCFLTHVQHPRAKVSAFDLIVAPEHDRLRGPNVIEVRGSLHGVTPAKLRDAAARFAPRYSDARRPLVAVLVGGSNSVYTLNDRTVDTLIENLTHLAEAYDAGLLITLSRRTGDAAGRRLRDALQEAAVEIWDETGENPYHAYLGLADAIVVTCDSVNMISEACSTGKPVYIVPLPGGEGSKFAAFHESLVSAGTARFFEGRLDSWSYDPLDETARAAREVRKRLAID